MRAGLRLGFRMQLLALGLLVQDTVAACSKEGFGPKTVLRNKITKSASFACVAASYFLIPNSLCRQYNLPDANFPSSLQKLGRGAEHVQGCFQKPRA